MNILNKLGLMTVAALALTGCEQAGTRAPESETGDLGTGNSLRKWADPTTGCVYLIYEHYSGNASTGGFTVRFRADGKPDCPGTAA